MGGRFSGNSVLSVLFSAILVYFLLLALLKLPTGSLLVPSIKADGTSLVFPGLPIVNSRGVNGGSPEFPCQLLECQGKGKHLPGPPSAAAEELVARGPRWLSAAG